MEWARAVGARKVPSQPPRNGLNEDDPPPANWFILTLRIEEVGHRNKFAPVARCGIRGCDSLEVTLGGGGATPPSAWRRYSDEHAP